MTNTQIQKLEKYNFREHSHLTGAINPDDDIVCWLDSADMATHEQCKSMCEWAMLEIIELREKLDATYV